MRSRDRDPQAFWLLAAVVGSVHAGFSFYWGLGGDWLVPTLGQRIVQAFAGLEWLLLPVGLTKLAAAWSPWLAARAGWPARRLSRGVCWLAAGVLLVWGGLNTIVGNLVLAGAIVPEGGFDRTGMIGHAFLWDPLFAVWGLALAVALARRRGRE